MSFVDHYEVLQISPNAEPETVHRVFRMLAMRYHPDNPETGDAARFMQLKQAYEVLKDSVQRAVYDGRRDQQPEQPMPVFQLKDFLEGTEGEANRRTGILCLLYHKRRVDPEEPSLSLLQLEGLMAFPREHLRFTIWYLLEKKFIRFNDSSEYEITGEGSDFAESNSPKHEELQRLLSAPQSVPPEPTKPKRDPVPAPPMEWKPPLQQPATNAWQRPAAVQPKRVQWLEMRPSGPRN